MIEIIKNILIVVAGIIGCTYLYFLDKKENPPLIIGVIACFLLFSCPFIGD